MPGRIEDGLVDRGEAAIRGPLRRSYGERVDQVLGPGTARRIEGILQGISDRGLQAVHAFAQSPPSYQPWLDDVDHAMAFAADLEAAAAMMREAEGTLDPDREAEVEALLPRGEEIIRALDAILRLARKDMLYAMSDAIEWYGTLGLGRLEVLRAQAELARNRTTFLVGELRAHAVFFDRHLDEREGSAFARAIDGIERSLGRLGTLAGGWRLATALDTAIGESDDAWTAAKALHAIGSMGVLELERALEGANPFRVAYERVATAIAVGETIADLGLTRQEERELHGVLGYARAVQAQYGPAMADYDAHLGEIRIVVGFFGFLARTAERVAAAVDDAERRVAAAHLRDASAEADRG